MVKRKRENKPLIIDVDAETSTSEGLDQFTKHRPCRKNLVGSLDVGGKKTTKLERRRTESNLLLALEPSPRRARSKRGIKNNNAIAEVNQENNKNAIAKVNQENNKNAIAKLIQEKRKLDSGLFDCYFELLWRSFPEDKRSSFAYLNCLWFSLYMKKSFKEKVLTWIKKKQIFLKKYVLVPIVCWRHWNLLIFCNFGESFESKAKPCILLLDSLEEAGPRRLEPDIRKFVRDIYRSDGRAENVKLISKIPFLVPKVPQQSGEECGLFVLYFINLFVQAAPENFSNDDYPYFMKQNWFSRECMEGFFEKLDVEK